MVRGPVRMPDFKGGEQSALSVVTGFCRDMVPAASIANCLLRVRPSMLGHVKKR